MISSLTIPETKEMLCAVCDEVNRQKQRLTLLDTPIGDGDHGIGMSRGVTNAKTALEKAGTFADIDEVFYRMGRAMIATMGGSSGVVFGTMFMGAADPLPEKQLLLTGRGFVRRMRNSLDLVKKRGKSEPGQKTMVDAFEPAVLAMEATVADARTEDGPDLFALARIAADAAEKGAEATKDMISMHGHSNTLGERALGHPDPGAVSVSIIFRAMEGYLFHFMA